jgi:hypothetical protein
MTAPLSRRSILAAGLGLSVIALPGCASIGNYAYEDAVRRLLLVSSQRAFARLLQEDGFFADDLTRIALPPPLAAAAQTGLLRLVNRAAGAAAERTAPIVTDAIQGLTIIDAASVIRGGPTAATDILKRELGEALFTALVPGVGDALRLADSDIVSRALAAAAGINLEGLQLDVARKASDAIYLAIGREEAAIRADPRLVGDMMLRAALTEQDLRRR